MVWPALIAAGGAIAGNILGNKANAKSADKQMDFQERMSSTALQRSAKDAEAAGLNRIIAFNNSASTPGGASYTSNFGDMGTSAGINALSTAQQIKNAKSQQDVIVEQANNFAASAKAANEQAEKAKQETENMRKMFPLLEEQTRATSDESRQRALQTRALTETQRQQTRIQRAEAEKAELEKLIYADPRSRSAFQRANDSLFNAFDANKALGDKVGEELQNLLNSGKQFYEEAKRRRTQHWEERNR